MKKVSYPLKNNKGKLLFKSKHIIHGLSFIEGRFSLSNRDIEELIKIRGITEYQATIQRWVFKFTPVINRNIRKRKRAVGLRWRLDETYIKVKGKWCHLYRDVYKGGKTIDFLLTHRRKKEWFTDF